MKLLICTTEYYPYGSGIANVAYNVVEQLKKMSVDCTVCSPMGPDIKLGSARMIEKFGILGLVYYWYRVSKYFKKNDFDIMWLHNPLLFKKIHFKRCLVTMHSTYYGKIRQRIYPKMYYKIVSEIEKYCLNKMEGVRFTGVGVNIRKELMDIGIAKEKIIYIPNGVDTKLFKPSDNKKLLRKKFGIPEDNLIILSLGRLTDVKQPLKLIEVFSIIEKEIKNISLIVAGNGELLGKAKTLTKKKNLKNIKFLGYVDHKNEAQCLYACSDFFVISSKYEGASPTLTVAEAMVSGLPCIVSDIQNLRFIRNIKAGIVVDFNNTSKAAKIIIEYLNNGDIDHSKNSREYALNNLDWKIIAKRYLKEFETINETFGGNRVLFSTAWWRPNRD